MKNTTLTILSMLLCFTLQAEEKSCLSIVGDHMTTVEDSNQFIADLTDHSQSITAYEITLLQKNLSARYKSLKNVLSLYEAKCTPQVLGTAVAIYDFSSMGQDVFTNTELRRVVKGFKKYPAFGLTDYIKTYELYTSTEIIEDTQEKIKKLGPEIPEDYQFEFTTFENDYDPNLHALSDTLINGAGTTVAGAARIWGFISDRLKWRSGRLNENQKIRNLVTSNLRPLDLIYEKRTFVLSNYTIPGHWGHVGIWLGTKEELIALNIWDQEYFRPYQKYVLEGKQIVEIRKHGANFQGLDTFLNLDEMAITRFPGISDRSAVVYKEIFFQLEKKYDFKFDARTADKITCAELISFSYGDIKWSESKALFQITLRPDDIARLTLPKANEEKTQEEFVLYIKGNKDNKEPSVLGYEDWKNLFKTKKKIRRKHQSKLPEFDVYGRGI